MTQFFQVIANSLAPGSIYALLGVGFVIAYRATRVINFLQGTLVYAGALFFASATTHFHGNHLLGALAAVLVSLVFGAFVFRVILAPLIGQGPLVLIMVTLVLGTSIMTGLLAMGFGTDARYVDYGLPTKAYRLPGGLYITPTDIATFAITVVLLIGLVVFVRYSRFGVRMRAGAENPQLAEYRGINVLTTSSVAWAIAAATATLAGLAFAGRVPVDPNMQNLGLYAFPAILIGGLDSILGTIIGAFALALIQNSAATYISGSATDIASYVTMLAILVVRPYGLLGTPEYRRL